MNEDLDLSEFYAEQHHAGGVCSVRTLMTEMKPDDLPKFQVALGRSELQHSAITAWCRKKGYRIGPESIGRHRRGLCQCEPSDG